MRFFYILSATGLLVGLFLLSGCAQAILATDLPKHTASPQATKEISSTAEHTQAAEPSPEPSSTQAATPPIQPTSEPQQGAQAVSDATVQRLAQEQNAAAADVRVLSVEPVNWRDSCLGVAKAGMMCAQVITPGYIVTLELNGQQYVYHTDGSGSQIVLAETLVPQPTGEIITWTQEEQGACNKLVVTGSALQFGACEGALQEDADIFRQLRDDLMSYVSKYATFSAKTAAGNVEFKGQGKQKASPAEQRMIAEWSRLAFQIAQAGRTGAAWGLALDWQREGGIAGFCDQVIIYLSGFASATSCKGNTAENPGRILLSPEQLDQVYAWVDHLASFNYEQKDPATTDAMQIRMAFSGSGSGKATEQDIQAMQGLAQDVLNQLQFAPDPMRTLKARTALEAYFAALKEGHYADAVAFFGGDAQLLSDWNPDLDPHNLPALFEQACAQQVRCDLSIAGYLDETRISPSDYLFTIELINPDGTPFSRGPCCGADPTTTPSESSFTFTVREVDGEYKVLDIPIYVP